MIRYTRNIDQGWSELLIAMALFGVTSNGNLAKCYTIVFELIFIHMTCEQQLVETTYSAFVVEMDTQFSVFDVQLINLSLSSLQLLKVLFLSNYHPVWSTFVYVISSKIECFGYQRPRNWVVSRYWNTLLKGKRWDSFEFSWYLA